MKSLLLLITSYLLLSTCNAQDFKGGVLLGATTSQVNGDDKGGFHKLGATFGGHIKRDFTQEWSGIFELRFSQKGSRDSYGTLTINLGYVEMPFLASYNVNEKLSFNGGASFGVRIFESIRVNDYKSNTSDFEGVDIPFILGAQYKLKENMAIDVRSAYSMVPINYKYINWCLYGAVHFYIKQ